MIKGLIAGALVVVIFGVGFLLGQYSSPDKNPETAPTSTEATVADTKSTPAPEESKETVETSPVSKIPVTEPELEVEADITVDTSQLTAGQKQLLETLGIDTENIIITPEMIRCAEEKIGVTRLTEIQSGDTPSFTEGLSLLTCYQL